MDTRAFPVECVRGYDAVDFASLLPSGAEEAPYGLSYRLPTEAEWEYACRGGSSTYQVYAFGNSLSSDQANFAGAKYLRRTCKVGSYPPNGFGLYDMHGNVLEWCMDLYDPNYYSISPRQDPQQLQGPTDEEPCIVLRGGCWSSIYSDCRSACRGRSPECPDDPEGDTGFRLVAVLSLTGN
jgi:formylglycine-generating enzyme required for sulfatase activity